MRMPGVSTHASSLDSFGRFLRVSPDVGLPNKGCSFRCAVAEPLELGAR